MSRHVEEMGHTGVTPRPVVKIKKNIYLHKSGKLQ